MRSSGFKAERLAGLTREVGAVLSRVDEVAQKVVGGLNMTANPNTDGQTREFNPKEHEELCGLAAAMLIRLEQAIGRIKANSQRSASPKTQPSYLRLAEKNEA